MPSNRRSLCAAVFVILLALPTLAAAQPFIQNAVPSSTGNILTINGVNFGAAPPAVYLNFQPLTVQSSSPTQVVAALPTLAPGTYSLIMIAGGQPVLSQVTIGGAGTLAAPPLAAATAIQGFASTPISQTASSFNNLTQVAERQTFRWLVEPLANNTNNPGGRLSLLFGTGANNPAPTGLVISEDGTIQFAAGQDFPGAVASVSAGPGLVNTGTADNPTLAMAHDGVGSSSILDGSVAAVDLSFNPATQPELDAHKTSADHDARYYTMTESEGLTKYTKLVTGGAPPIIPTGAFAQIGIPLIFTKARAASSILLHWNGSVSKVDFPFASNFCEYQLRIDGGHDGSSGGGAGRFITGAENAYSVHVTALFESLAAGVHTVAVWARGNAAQCWINPDGRPETFIVEEAGN